MHQALGHSDNPNELREMGVALNSVRASAEDIELFFETFPEGGPWRLVWINGPHSNATDPFDPLIDCLFVGIGGNSVPKRALAGAGWLPLLIIGSVWHDGQKIADSAETLEDCTLDVTVGSNRIREFGGYDPVSPQRKTDYILPPHVYRLHSRDVRLVGVQVGNDPYGLIIPALTLAQFYIGTSTALAQALLNGAFLRDPGSLCDLTRTRMEIVPADPSSSATADAPWRVLRIAPRAGFGRDDCCTLGRFFGTAENSAERQAFCLPFLAAMAAAAGRRPASLYATFPLTGRTRLTGEGKRFTATLADGTPTERVLLLRLFQCTAPFPFDELIIERCEDEPAGTHDEGGRVLMHSIAGYVGPKRVVNNRRPNRHLPQEDLKLPSIVPRFPALSNLPLRVETIQRATTSTPVVHIPGEVLVPDEVSSGVLGADQGTVRRVRLITGNEQPPADPPTEPEVDLFCDVLRALSCHSSVTGLAGLVVPPGAERHHGEFTFGCLPPHPNGGWWHKITDRLTRMVLVAEFSVSGRWSCLMGLEPRPKHPKDWEGVMLIAQPDGSRLSEQDLCSVVTAVRARRGQWGERMNGRGVGDLRHHLLFTKVRTETATVDQIVEAVLARAEVPSAHSSTDAEHTHPDPAAGEDRSANRRPPASR